MMLQPEASYIDSNQKANHKWFECQRDGIQVAKLQLYQCSNVMCRDCSPNGYYFVPVDPGTYTVKASALPPRPCWLASAAGMELDNILTP